MYHERFDEFLIVHTEAAINSLDDMSWMNTHLRPSAVAKAELSTPVLFEAKPAKMRKVISPPRSGRPKSLEDPRHGVNEGLELTFLNSSAWKGAHMSRVESPYSTAPSAMNEELNGSDLPTHPPAWKLTHGEYQWQTLHAGGMHHSNGSTLGKLRSVSGSSGASIIICRSLGKMLWQASASVPHTLRCNARLISRDSTAHIGSFVCYG